MVVNPNTAPPEIRARRLNPEGGLGEAVRSVFTTLVVPILSLALRQKPKNGKPAELFDYEGIPRSSIAQRVRALLVP